MQRELSQPRSDGRARAQKLGLSFDNTDTPYWNETARYRFTRDQIETIEAATLDLHHMCLNAVQYVIDHKLYDRLAIPQSYIPYIEESWRRRDPYIYGRFDLSYDGKSPPKMLEYNADTPTALLEAAVIQWDWLQTATQRGILPAKADQFNFIHESLRDAWKAAAHEFTSRDPVTFACTYESLEDSQTTEYLRSVAEEAGITGQMIDIKDVGYDSKAGNFVDLANQPIKTMFKLYPWEWMAHSDYGDAARNADTRFIEPVWKMILSNKGLLAILWEMYPGHENLLPAYLEPQRLGSAHVKKPLISREGANITIVNGNRTEMSRGDYGDEGHVYQAFCPLPNFDGHFPVIGSWVTSSEPRYAGFPQHPRGGEACGIGIREDNTLITKNTSRFVPHYFL